MDNNEWKVQKEEAAGNEETGAAQEPNRDELVIPVVQEFLTVDKEVVETGRVNIRKTVTEEETALNIPLLSEHYDVQRIPKKEVHATAPVPRQEGDTIIVPVVKEILVIEKRYEVTEEVHLIRRTTSTPHVQQITLLKENVEVIRTDADGNKKRL
jgi:uncharacterized protein (TIGR02271 family)